MDLRSLSFNIGFKGDTSGIKQMNSAADKMKNSVGSALGEMDSKSTTTAKSMRSQAASLAAEYKRSGMNSSDAWKKAWSEIERESKTGSDKVSNELGGIAGSFKGLLAGIGIAVVVDKIKDFGVAAVESAGSAQAMNSQFTQVFGSLETQAQSAVDGLADKFGMVPNLVKPSMSAMTSMFKGLGLDTESAMSKAADAVTISADAAAFYDKSYEDANSALTSFIKGNYEGGESVGLFANDTQMAAYAIQQGVAGSTAEWQSLDEATKQATRLEYAQNMQEMAGAVGQAAREQDGLENQLGNVKQAWSDFLAIVGGPVLGVAVQGLKGITDLLGGMGSGFKAIQDGVGALNFTGLQAEFAPFGEMFSGIKDSAVNTFGGLVQTIKDALPGIMTASKPVLDGFKTMWDAMKPAMLEVGGLISNTIIPVIGFMYQKWIEMLPSVIAFFSPIYEAIAGVGTILSSVVGFVAAVLQGDWASAWDFAGNIVTGIGQVINGVTDFIKNIITGAVDRVKSKFGEISGFIVSAFDTAIEFITGLPDKFLQWGSDMIQGLIDGITSKISDITDTISGVAETISSYIHFSRPDVGPLHYYEEWMPDFMKGLASGITGNMSLIKDAMAALSDDMSADVQVGVNSNAPAGIKNGVVSSARTKRSTDTGQSHTGGSFVFSPNINLTVPVGSTAATITGDLEREFDLLMERYEKKLRLRNPSLAR